MSSPYSFPTRRSSDLVAASTPSRSNHSRALLEAMSALFWWSAETISTLNSGLASAIKSAIAISVASRSEEHTSELQSRENLVCRLLLEKKNDESYYK